MKKRINPRYIVVDLSKSIVIYSFLVLLCCYLCADNFIHGVPSIGLLALFCAVMTAIALAVLVYCKYGKHPRMIFMHIAVIIQCFVYWITFTIFLYTGGTGGTSIFLFFAAAPACFYFFNLFYSSIFCFVFFVIMCVYVDAAPPFGIYLPRNVLPETADHVSGGNDHVCAGPVCYGKGKDPSGKGNGGGGESKSGKK